MKNRENLIFGMLLGAGIMYLLDPDRGARRRALIRDQMVHGANELEGLGGGMASKARHFRNRARGAMVEARHRMHEEAIDDAVLAARVRSQLGRLVSTPRHVEVTAEHGRVTLRGMAPDEEVRTLVDGVQHVPGVHDVINRLESRENA